jgi:hypothetical protein
MNRGKIREDSTDRTTRKAIDSPKCFSDLKKSRVALSNEPNPNSVRKGRMKTEDNTDNTNNPITPSKANSPKLTNLFKELCKEKGREQSIQKNESRGASKENLNTNEVKQKANEKEKVTGNFQSLLGNGNIKKYGEEKKVGGFGALKKTSKIPQR